MVEIRPWASFYLAQVQATLPFLIFPGAIVFMRTTPPAMLKRLLIIVILPQTSSNHSHT